MTTTWYKLDDADAIDDGDAFVVGEVGDGGEDALSHAHDAALFPPPLLLLALAF